MFVELFFLFLGKCKFCGLGVYDIGKCLGFGGFGEVYIVRRKCDGLLVSIIDFWC